METWLEKKECTGCGACANICPKNAISMEEDKCGFKYPKIDKNKCINCGLCKNTCPVVEKPNRDRLDNLKAYAGWSKDKDNRYISTSGGLFTEFSKVILSENGYIVGAAYNEENMVQHILIDNAKDLEKLRQSKYLQSNINYVFREIRQRLNENKLVAFCGSPCQVAGLYKFLKKDYENLFTMEFICRGMNSPKAYKSWINEIENKERKNVKKVWFKYKVNGWNSSPMCTRLDFNDDSFKVLEGKKNLYMKGYLESNLYIRPSCGNCYFNGIQRVADVTLADFWGIDKELDDDKGTSLILINTEKGEKYFNKVKNNIECFEKDVEDIYKGNVCFTTSVNINKNSEKFLSELNDNNFSKKIIKYTRFNYLKKLKRKIKNKLNI